MTSCSDLNDYKAKLIVFKNQSLKIENNKEQRTKNLNLRNLSFISLVVSTERIKKITAKNNSNNKTGILLAMVSVLLFFGLRLLCVYLSHNMYE